MSHSAAAGSLFFSLAEGDPLVWKVEYKHANASSAWSTHGTYGSESSAMSVAAQITHKHLVVRAVDPHGNVAWSA